MKSYRIFLLILTLTFLPLSSAFSFKGDEEQSKSAYSLFPMEEYTLENGLEVYFFEDQTSPVITIELNVRAGFSKQTPSTCGFFPLYTRIIRENAKNSRYLKNMIAECNADSARYIIEATDLSFIPAIEQFSKYMLNPVFPDDVLIREFEATKKEVRETALSAQGFINSAIDYRIFPEKPWKNDSGIYTGIFNTTTIPQCRKILSNIAKNYYRPSNAAIFISGAISSKKVMETLKKNFEHFKDFIPDADAEEDFSLPQNSQSKKFVLYSGELSSDITQIVVQYTDLEMNKADIIAQILDRDNSTFKTGLVQDEKAGIKSAYYINAQSTHTKSGSRCIIQAIIENNAASPCEKARQFLTHLGSIKNSTESEFNFAQMTQMNTVFNMLTNSKTACDFASQYWTIKGFGQTKLDDSLDFHVSKQLEEILELQLSEVMNCLDSKEPFVFVLVNSRVYAKYKDEFEKAGFQAVNPKNAGWDSQTVFAKLKEQSQNINEQENDSQDEYDFYAKNIDQLWTVTLENGIVSYCTVEKPFSLTTGFSLIIKGGELIDSPENHGTEEVAVNCLSANYMELLRKKLFNYEISQMPEVKVEIGLTQSVIYTECLSRELNEVLKALGDALTTTDIIPALADSMVTLTKSSRILKVASPTWQMYCSGLNSFYNNKNFLKINSTNQNILNNISVAKIKESYFKLFNAQRISFAFSTAFDTPVIDRCLRDANINLIPIEDFSVPEIPQLKEPLKKSKKIRLNHQFFTDVSADKAGPRPAVLIPTTEFFDPVQIWIYKKDSSKDALYKALAAYFCQEYENLSGLPARIESNDVTVPFTIINLLNVKSVSRSTSDYKEIITSTIERLKDPSTAQEILDEIKNAWIYSYMSKFTDNRGTCNIICELVSNNKAHSQIALDYRMIMEIDTAWIIELLENDFNFDNTFKVYSVDSKK